MIGSGTSISRKLVKGMTANYRNSASNPGSIRTYQYSGRTGAYRPAHGGEICPVGDETLALRSYGLTTPDLSLVHVKVEGANVRRGSATPGRTFGYTYSTGAPNRWCGHSDEGRSILCFPREFEATCSTGFNGVGITFSEDALASNAELMEYGWSPKNCPAMIEVDAKKLTSIRKIGAMLEEIGKNLFEVDHSEVTSLAQQLCCEIVGAVGGSVRRRRPRLDARRRAFVRATQFIEENIGEPLTLRDMCQFAHVSARTLEYGFNEFSGLSPMAYLKSCRLCGALQDLEQRAVTGESVTFIANRWGFWHMGQFAADFKRAYGLRPREVARSNRR